jgi:intergrase/recombinase
MSFILQPDRKAAEAAVVKTLLSYINRTKDVRKTSRLLISFVTYDEVTTSTLARWLKSVLELSGINSSIFKAHSFRGAAGITLILHILLG